MLRRAVNFQAPVLHPLPLESQRRQALALHPRSGFYGKSVVSTSTVIGHLCKYKVNMLNLNALYRVTCTGGNARRSESCAGLAFRLWCHI